MSFKAGLIVCLDYSRHMLNIYVFIASLILPIFFDKI